jgi:tetratricopeptide (TPR) repeat protein
MEANERIDPDEANAAAYDNLIVAVESSQGVMSLLLAVCDDVRLRDEIIERYEAELQPQIRPYRVALDREEPSLKRAVAEQVEQDSYLSEGGNAVVTVTGAEQLLFLKLGKERSEQEIFFGYLQWTREGMREFRFPIILWVTNQLLGNLSRRAPDFWSWRKDIFRFVSKKTIIVPQNDVDKMRPMFEQLNLSEVTENDSIPLQDLQQLITATEARKPDDLLLATLYASLGRIYAGRLKQGSTHNYPLELSQAIESFQKAVNLQEPLRQELDLANNLNELAGLYEFQGRYNEAESLSLRSLKITERQLGQDHPIFALSLNNLATLYSYQGRYSEAELLFLRSLEITERQLGPNHLSTASSLGNLALFYTSQGRYSEAEPLFLRSLEITERRLGADHLSAASRLQSLATLYSHQGRYSEAELLDRRSLEITKRHLGLDHCDTACILSNLAALYCNQGRYIEAEPLYLRSLEIKEQNLPRDHPDTLVCRRDLAKLYSKLAKSHQMLGRHDKAAEYFNQSIKLRLSSI